MALSDVVALFPTPKAWDGLMGRPRTKGRPIEKSTHLGTIVTLLPTPDTGCSPNGHGRRGGAKGNGHQSGGSLDSVARDLGQAGAGSVLPTPTASAYGSNRSPSPGAAVRPSLGGVVKQAMLPTPSASDGSGGRGNSPGHQRTLPGTASELEVLPTPTATERGDCPSERARRSPDIQAVSAHFPQSSAWGKYEAAIQRWEAVTRPAPAPTEPNRNANPRLSARFVEWMMGLPAGWVVYEPGLSRTQQLKALGNGVVPQQAAAALALLLDEDEWVA